MRVCVFFFCTLIKLWIQLQLEVRNVINLSDYYYYLIKTKKNYLYIFIHSCARVHVWTKKKKIQKGARLEISTRFWSFSMLMSTYNWIVLLVNSFFCFYSRYFLFYMILTPIPLMGFLLFDSQKEKKRSLMEREKEGFFFFPLDI